VRSIGIRLGIIAVIIIIGVVVQTYISKNAGDLRVGDCFDVPTKAGETVDDVKPSPCTDPHGAEVVFVGNYTPDTKLYPSDGEFTTFFQSACTTAFNTYTGIDFATDTTYDMSAFTPTADGWSSGDRKVICYAVRLDATQLTTSIKKS
jgi:hypothetical protein